MGLFSRSFFESDPIAGNIRAITVDGAKAYEELLIGVSGGTDKVLDTHKKLSALGVVPSMHVIARDDPEAETKKATMLSEPRIAAEYIGGQLLTLLKSDGTLSLPPTAVLHEHNLMADEDVDVVVVAPETSDPRIADFSAQLSMCNVLILMLDATDAAA